MRLRILSNVPGQLRPILVLDDMPRLGQDEIAPLRESMRRGFPDYDLFITDALVDLPQTEES